MHKSKFGIVIVASSALLWSVAACGPGSSQPPKAVCGGYVPGWAVTEALGTTKIEPGRQYIWDDAPPTFECLILENDDKGISYSLEIQLNTLEWTMKNNVTRKKVNERPKVKSGKLFRMEGYSGTIDAHEAWFYPACNGAEYAIHVSVPYKSPGSTRAVRAIVKSLLDALQQRKECRAGSASPSSSGS